MRIVENTRPQSKHLLKRADSIAMWHEAGHAIVAMHYGRKVFSYGIDPLPHCIPNTLFMSNYEKGVLLCAGAAMTKVVFGKEWGGNVTDWPMARTLGDIEVFKAEAEMLCDRYKSQAKHLVHSRDDYLSMSWVRDMRESDPLYAESVRAARKAVMPRWAKKLTMRWARFQIRHPQLSARLGF